MSRTNEEPQILHALGGALDRRHAHGVEITFYETYLTVAWEGARGGRERWTLSEDEALSLRSEPDETRTEVIEPGQLSNLLSALGNQLRDAELEATSIVEERDGFRVCGAIRGRYDRRWYRKEALRPADSEQRPAAAACTLASLRLRLAAQAAAR